MRKTIRIGIVGAGFAGRAHSLAYANIPTMYPGTPAVRRVRLFDVNQELADEAASRLGWEEATDDWRMITRADDVDLVDIVTPTSAHAEIAIDAARHGKHVFCEKPLADRADSAKKMYEAVQASGRLHAVSFSYRLWPAIAFAKQLIDDGRIGKPLQFHARYLHEFALDPRTPLSWRLNAATAGAGSLADIGSHLIDAARDLVGEIARVCAIMRTFVESRPLPAADSAGEERGFGVDTAAESGEHGRVDVDDATTMLVEFQNGAAGVIETNWMAAGHNNELSFEISGERGAIQFNWLQNTDLRVRLADDPPELAGFRTIPMGPNHPEAGPYGSIPGFGMSQRDAFSITVHEVLDAIAAERPAKMDFFDGLRACEIIDAARRSNESGSWQHTRSH
jgi:predicted dehydrogenase